MSREEIIHYLGSSWVGMLSLLDGSLSTDVPLLKEINGKVLAHGGKMLRPMTALLMADACGGINSDSIHFAAASEMLHNATLMHDDVADDSSQRRGNPTVASMIGPTAAVLVGDFWLARAMMVVTESENHSKVTKVFADTLTDLAEGEMIQLQKAGDSDTTEQDYYRIIYCKTASLFVTSVVSAAVSTSASESEVNAARAYGKALGIAFQIKDDILDYVGDERLGKPVGSDILEQKITLPVFGAFRNRPEKEEVIRRMITDIHTSPENTDKVRSFVMENGGIDYAAEQLQRSVDEAVSALSVFPDGKAKDYLAQIAGYNTFRTV